MCNKLIAASCVSVLFALSADSQGTFQNLDFEMARPTLGVLNATTNALPGWKAYGWGIELNTVTYNSGGGAFYNPVQLMGMGNGQISGNFSVLLSSGYSGSDSIGSITQTGFVPADTKSVFFKAIAGHNTFAVSVDGQSLSCAPLYVGPDYSLYGADISRFAGRTETLTFSAGSSVNVVRLDDVEFSSQPIPETGTGLLLFFASGVFLCIRKCKRNQFHN